MNTGAPHPDGDTVNQSEREKESKIESEKEKEYRKRERERKKEKSRVWFLNMYRRRACCMHSYELFREAIYTTNVRKEKKSENGRE